MSVQFILSLMGAASIAQEPASASQTDQKPLGFIATSGRCPTNGTAADDIADSYTRLEFVAKADVPIGTDYSEELRKPLYRFLAGKAATRVLTLNATYSRHKVMSTTTVASFTHKSSRSGYAWSSEVSNQRIITPYFRIDPDGVVSTNWKLALNKTYDTKAAQDLMDIVKRAATLITPSSGLLTSLNEARFKDSSQFIDQSVSNFLRESVDEIAPDEFPLLACTGQNLITLTLVLPTKAQVVRSSAGRRTVGTWTLRLTKPIRSIFYPNSAARLSPAGVLAQVGSGTVFDYRVSDGLSLGQFLNGDNALTALRDEFKATGNDAARTARKLCALIGAKLQGIGLNRFDTAVAIGAYSDQFLSERGQRDALVNTQNCAILSTT